MSTSLKITLSILLILQIIFIVRTLKRKKLVVKYASMWFLIIICLFVAIIFPNILIDLAKLFGFEKASNMIFLLGYFVLFYIIFIETISISKLRKEVVSLIQEVSILKESDKFER